MTSAQSGGGPSSDDDRAFRRSGDGGVGLTGMGLRLRAIRPTLQPSLARVVDVVLTDPAAAARSSIRELAAAAGTSEATVVRLCKRLGLRGYADLRLGLAHDSGVEQQRAEVAHSGDIDPADPLDEIVRKIAFNDAKAVEETARFLSVPTLQRVVTAIIGARRVDLYGSGASAVVAEDLGQKLFRIGVVANAWSDHHQALTSAALLGRADVAIAFSDSGRTVETVDALRRAGERGASTVAVTADRGSPLADVCVDLLTTVSRDTTLRSAATSSRMAQLAMADFIFAGVVQGRFADATAALSATAGALRGRRL